MCSELHIRQAAGRDWRTNFPALVVGAYYLMPAVMHDGTMEITWDYPIGKRELHVRETWQVGRHDPDCSSSDADGRRRGGSTPVQERGTRAGSRESPAPWMS